MTVVTQLLVLFGLCAFLLLLLFRLVVVCRAGDGLSVCVRDVVVITGVVVVGDAVGVRDGGANHG